MSASARSCPPSPGDEAARAPRYRLGPALLLFTALVLVPFEMAVAFSFTNVKLLQPAAMHAGLCFLSGLQGISLDPYEAADVMGASRRHKFIDITLPGLKHTLVFFIFVLLLSLWQNKLMERHGA